MQEVAKVFSLAPENISNGSQTGSPSGRRPPRRAGHSGPASVGR